MFILKLHRLELTVHNVHLSVTDCEDVTFQISRARGFSFVLKMNTVLCVHKTGATAVHSVLFRLGYCH